MSWYEDFHELIYVNVVYIVLVDVANSSSVVLNKKVVTTRFIKIELSVPVDDERCLSSPCQVL